VRAVAIPVQRKEVIPRVEQVGADLLDPVDGAAERVVRAVLRVELDGHADRSHVRGITSESNASVSPSASCRGR
jgi:hypothetical protein